MGESYRAPGCVPIELMLNEMQVMQPLNMSLTYLMMKNNISAILRDSMTTRAISMGVKFIFYWDDDVLLPTDTWYKMLANMNQYPDIGLITGVVWTKMDPTEPLIYKEGGGGAWWDFSTDPKDEPMDIYASGAGCMMARVSMLKELEAPVWYDQRTGNADGSAQGILGHDIRLCRKIHEETNYRVTVDGSIQCMHFDHRSQRGYQMPDSFKARQAQGVDLGPSTAPAGIKDLGLPDGPVSVEEVEEILEAEGVE